MKQLVWLKLACTLSTSWTPMEAWIIGELPPSFLAAVSNGSGVRSCLAFTYSHSFPKDQRGILSRFCPPLRSRTRKESTSQFPMLVRMWQNINLPNFSCQVHFYAWIVIYLCQYFFVAHFVYQERGDQVLISNMRSNLVPRAFPFICSYFSLNSIVCVGVIDKSLFHTNTCCFFFFRVNLCAFLYPQRWRVFCKCFVICV